VFFCAIRDDIEAPPLVLKPKHRWVSAGESTEDVQVLTAGDVKDTKPPPCYAELYPKTKEGKDFSKAYRNKTGKRGYFAGKILDRNNPSFGLISQDQHFFHWETNRLLTYREWKRLGSFPDDYQAKTDKIGKYMIGMSVPPKMTEAVARAVIDQWLLRT
jgi:site-specific DNA-cytosine methylase